MRQLSWRDTEGSQEERPPEIEANSNDVFLRENITAFERDGTRFWQYREAITDKDGALEYLANKNKELLSNVSINTSDIDYIAMEAGVNLSRGEG